MTETLAEVAAGCEALVLRVEGPNSVRRRLMDLGLVRGARVRVERRAPLGDPLEISMRGAYLALRRQEAACVIVEPTASGAEAAPAPERGRQRWRFGWGRRG